jgi:hypothetical protein
MNVMDILMYGDQTLLGTVEDLAEADWEVGGVCGVWSVKDIMAHLASYEHLLAEALDTFSNNGIGPNMAEKANLGEAWNDLQVERRRHMTAGEVLAEYKEVHGQVMARAAQIPPETSRQQGTIPWYGPEYSLDDFIVYSSYGHKREHSAQINVYKDRLQG